MSKFVRYQERTLIRDNTWVLVVDTLIDLDYYMGKFIDAEIAKDTIRHPGEWFDNGNDCHTGSTLQHRVVRVYDEEEGDVHSEIKSKLHTTPFHEELKTLYNLNQKFRFFEEV